MFIVTSYRCQDIRLAAPVHRVTISLAEKLLTWHLRLELSLLTYIACVKHRLAHVLTVKRRGRLLFLIVIDCFGKIYFGHMARCCHFLPGFSK